MLTLSHITHTYRRASRPALSDVTAELTPGVYGILGPNGSGKTTLMNIITDNLVPSAGEVRWDGAPVRKMGKEYRGPIADMPLYTDGYNECPLSAY